MNVTLTRAAGVLFSHVASECVGVRVSRLRGELSSVSQKP